MVEREPKFYTSFSDKPRLQLVVSEGDLKMLNLIQEELGVGRSEAVRTALRVYGALLVQARKK